MQFKKYILLIMFAALFEGAQFVHADTGTIDPNGNGTTLQGTQTTCGAGGNYNCVNDAVRSPTAPSTSGDYITLASNKEDIYTMSTVPNVSTVTSIEVFLYHKESNAAMQPAIHLWNEAESSFLASPQNTTNRTTAQWDSVTFSGLSLSQTDLDAMRIGVLCEKTAAGAAGSCNAYALYAVVTHTNSSLFTQEDFRFYINQEDLLTPTNDPWPEGGVDLKENEAVKPGHSMGRNSVTRIRMNIAVSNAALATSTQDFNLQYALLTAPSCVEQGSGWSDVGARFTTDKDFRLYSNAFADTAPIDTLVLSTSNVGGSYSELNPTPTNPKTAATGKFIEYDWPIQLVSSASGNDYCFRMVKSSGSLLDVYRSDSYPKVRTLNLGSGVEEGGNAPPGQDIGGGDPTGGTEIGDSGGLVGFSSASATGEDYTAWLNAGSAYVSDNSNASALLSSLQQDYYNFGLGVPEGNAITGIEIALEVSTAGTGEIQVDLSFDGGATYTTAVKSTGSLTSTDSIKVLGSGGDLWGRSSWSAGEISNTNFRVRVTSVGVVDSVRIDHIQAKVHHITTGGGGGGGGEVWAPLFRLFANVFGSVTKLAMQVLQ